jgi:hypothetical protein
MRFYDNLEDKDALIINAIDVFEEKWMTTPKPYKLNEYIARKTNRPVDQEACRFTAPQNLVYISDNNEIRYNTRKLNVLPHLFSELSHDKAIEMSCKNIFFNYEFMQKKFLTGDANTVITEFSSITRHVPMLKNDNTRKLAKEMQVLLLSMFQCMHTLHNYPSNFALQFTSRLLRFYSSSETIKNFIDECDSLSVHHCALLAPYQYMPSLGGGLFITMDKHVKPITWTLFDTQYLVTCSDKINVFVLGKYISIYV